MRSFAAATRAEFAEQIRYRELLVQLTVRDLLLRYKQTFLGFGWALFMPLVHTVMFSIVFTRVAPIETSVPYPVYVYCGLLPWNFFASSLRFAATSLTSNAVLVTKIYFPREIFPISAVLVSFVDFLVASTVLVALMAYYGLGASWSLLFLPVIIAVQIIFTAGIALLLAMANLYYRDVKYLFDVVLTAWMFATSVVYPIELVGGRLGEFLKLNPMTPIIDGYRSVILEGRLPPSAPFLAVTVVAVSTFVIGWTVFHRAETQFAENF